MATSKAILGMWYTPCAISFGLAEHEDPPESGIAAGVADHPTTHPDHGAVALEPELHVLHLPPTVGQRHHVLRAGLDPFDRAAELQGELGRDHALRREMLRPERTPDIGSDDPHPLGRRLPTSPDRTPRIMCGIWQAMCTVRS